MSFIACPHCNGKIGFGPIDAVPAELPRPKRQTNGQITPLRTKALEDIHNTLVALGAGQWTNSEIYAAYVNVAKARGVRPITSHALSMGLSAYGLEKWRKTRARGWVIPEEIPPPRGMSQASRERLFAEEYRQTVASGGPAPAVPNAPAPSASREETKQRLLTSLGWQ